ncbi:MAG: helix-turn-helix transcriptional regulator [Candidatus Magasanikbacteria bacterium]
MLNRRQLGQKLRRVRKELDYSQEFVSNELGINRQAIIAIEKGERRLDSIELFQLADLYGLDIQELIGEEKEENEFKEKVMHLRNKENLSDQDKKSLMEFYNICQDFEYLKNLQDE